MRLPEQQQGIILSHNLWEKEELKPESGIFPLNFCHVASDQLGILFKYVVPDRSRIFSQENKSSELGGGLPRYVAGRPSWMCKYCYWGKDDNSPVGVTKLGKVAALPSLSTQLVDPLIEILCALARWSERESRRRGGAGVAFDPKMWGILVLQNQDENNWSLCIIGTYTYWYIRRSKYYYFLHFPSSLRVVF